ncbi:pyridine nucleotide-disulfide oxidoreductase-domain-containing protein [Hypoxylon sp. NC1633]|nr:pyridine nucleotide-disulfide oxidoreductase-domain-containing protein [Hypoxylon sp. NC1633]
MVVRKQSSLASILSHYGRNTIELGVPPMPRKYARRYSVSPSPRLYVGKSHRHNNIMDFQPAVNDRNMTSLDAIVVGGGASGIATVANLLEHLPTTSSVGWIDPDFQGGRINDKYREVPSNTKVSHFLKYFTAVKPFRRIAETTPQPNAITALQNLPRNETCSLSYAGDMLQMLSDGLLKDRRVASWQGIVTGAKRTRAKWSLDVHVYGTGSRRLETPLVVYCTGSFPIVAPLPAAITRSPVLLELDVCLTPSLLSYVLPQDRDVCIGVIGASHSAVLVLMNLFSLSRKSHPQLRVRWFSRAINFKYAEDKGDWILYDNTGLKGSAAEFAREQLDGDKLLHSDAGKIITRIDCSGGPDQEKKEMIQHIPGCGFLVQAIGYRKNPLPEMENKQFDNETGGFVDTATKTPIPGLYGAGIAFPERVVDPVGNVEYAVGFLKFMKFLQRVVPNWVKATR